MTSSTVQILLLVLIVLAVILTLFLLFRHKGKDRKDPRQEHIERTRRINHIRQFRTLLWGTETGSPEESEILDELEKMELSHKEWQEVCWPGDEDRKRPELRKRISRCLPGRRSYSSG